MELLKAKVGDKVKALDVYENSTIGVITGIEWDFNTELYDTHKLIYEIDGIWYPSVNIEKIND